MIMLFCLNCNVVNGSGVDTKDKQFTVYTEDQMLNECIKANFVDCRLNAYPYLDLGQNKVHDVMASFLRACTSKSHILRGHLVYGS